MPSSTLQGLNIVHPAQEVTDSHDLLLGQAYPDLSAQLDLWTNLAFESEEPLSSRHDDHKNSKSISDEEEDEVRSPVVPEKSVHANLGNTNIHHSVPNAFDINAFLAGFAMDQQFTAVPPAVPHQQPGTMAPSLAQILALHSGQGPSFNAGFPSYPPPPATSTFTRPAAPPAAEDSYVPTKRARTRKESITSVGSPDFREESSPPTTLSAAEDKRRRNTAASARFRLKKKEREAALEGKAKELEAKVTELERECEGLRRENGWLKGLVVGVTGAAQAPSANQITVASPPSPVSTGSKRRREDAQTA